MLGLMECRSSAEVVDCRQLLFDLSDNAIIGESMNQLKKLSFLPFVVSCIGGLRSSTGLTRAFALSTPISETHLVH